MGGVSQLWRSPWGAKGPSPTLDCQDTSAGKRSAQPGVHLGRQRAAGIQVLLAGSRTSHLLQKLAHSKIPCRGSSLKSAKNKRKEINGLTSG